MKLKKHSGKDLIAYGGAGLAQTGLIDEFWFLTHPVALGHGLPLFSLLPKPLYLKLVSVTRFDLVQLHTCISDRQLGDSSVT
jgi:dihydrofolate reductase